MAAANFLIKYAPVLVLLVAWQAITYFGNVPDYILPQLTSVADAFVEVAPDELFYNTMQSLMRGFTALALAIVVGIVLGVLMAQIRPARLLLKPFIQMFYPMPKSALIPIVIVWFGLGDMSKIFLIFIGSLLPIVMSSFNAACGIDRLLVWSAQSFGSTRSELLTQVIFPAALPEILAGVRVALGLSFVLMVSSEFIIGNDGIGFAIMSMGEVGLYSGMWAGILTISIIGLFADQLFGIGMRRALRWQETNAG
jgi:ABC-type nitrate/sulfonate/bicarbonate transport system permease component